MILDHITVNVTLDTLETTIQCLVLVSASLCSKVVVNVIELYAYVHVKKI